MEPINKKRIFTLAPVEDDIGGVLKAARREVLASGISFGAKVLYCLVLDLSMDGKVNRGPGILVASDTFLSPMLNANRSSLWRWKRELSSGRWLALKESFQPNMWPMTKYVLRCLHPDDESTNSPTRGQLWGNATTRGDPIRGTKSRKGHLLQNEAGDSKNGNHEKPEQNSVSVLQNEYPPAAKCSRGTRKMRPGNPQNAAGEPAKCSRGTRKMRQGNPQNAACPTAK